MKLLSQLRLGDGSSGGQNAMLWFVDGGVSSGALLVVLGDRGGRQHFAYSTARRTLCLDHLVGEFEIARELGDEVCPRCETARRKLRGHRREWLQSDRVAAVTGSR